MAASNPGLPLFYRNPEPLDAERHARLSLRLRRGLGFSARVNAVPVNLAELAQISRFYPIAFSPAGTVAAVVAIVGLRDDENLFVSEDGAWQPHVYIPAYVRRFPFILAEAAEQFMLCVDRTPETVIDGADNRLFKADGSPTQLTLNALEFCKSYHAAAQQTSMFCRRVEEIGLLSQKTVRLDLGGGRRLSFSGFRLVDDAAFRRLSGGMLAELRDAGYLDGIYAHRHSAGQWSRLAALLNERLGLSADASPPHVPPDVVRPEVDDKEESESDHNPVTRAFQGAHDGK